jgi:excisionase family DNA binding protein
VTSALFYTTEEVSRYLRIPERTIKSNAEEGHIPGAVKIGKQWRFDREKLEEYLKRRLPDPEGEAQS